MASPTVSDIRMRREAVVDAHIRAEAVDHDVASTLATFRHPRYEVPALGAIADGPDAVSGVVGAVLSAFPDLYLHKTAVHHAENAVIVECVFGGTPTRRVGWDPPDWKGDGSTGRIDLPVRRR